MLLTIFDKEFAVSDGLLEKFVTYAEKEGVVRDSEGYARSKKYIKLRLKAQIANNLYEDNGFYRVMMASDETFQKGLEVLKNYENTNRQITKRNKQKVPEDGTTVQS